MRGDVHRPCDVLYQTARRGEGANGKRGLRGGGGTSPFSGRSPSGAAER